MESEQRHPVEILAEEFAERLRRGEAPSIDEYIVRLPDQAATIRTVFAPILAIERVSDEELAERQFNSRTIRLTREDTQLGDFQIVRQLGRGGMGIVYEAVQQSLGRHVALKVLTPDMTGSDEQVRRFRKEAAAFAKLHHTNIVPIFGSGEAEGLHFYAMQFIDGVTLADVIAQRARMQMRELQRDRLGGGADFFRNVAHLGHDVADALAHAHQQGIIHRDIKPGNLMLEGSTVWITDFGIAKLTDETSQTRTGMLLGTLRYMAPEQFNGRSDARSDIYSLGLTLFELVALRPAFSDTTHATLIKSKMQQAPPRLRSLCPDIPRDLETIIHKACATEATARYPTAAALTEDLQRFLDDRPILARRATSLERVSRWARRNPAVASLSFAVVSSLAALAIVFANGNYQMGRTLVELKAAKELADQNLAEKAAALDVAEQQRLLAASNLTLAIEAFDEIMRNIGGRGGAEALSVELNDGEVAYGAGVVTEADAEMLGTLLKFFDRFSQDNATELLAETAAANHRVGDILFQLGRIEEAEAAYLTALEQIERLLASKSKRVQARETATQAIENASDVERALIEQLQLLNALGLAIGARGAIDEAQQCFRRVAELYQTHPIAAARSDAQFEYARSINLRNSTISRLGLPQARQLTRPTPETRRAAAPDLATRRARAALAGSARLVHRESKALNLEAIELLDPLVKAHPKRVDFALELAHAYREQARIARNALDPNVAQEAFRATLELLERLMDEHPSSPYLKFVYADTVTSMAPTPNRRAGQALQRALQIANTLVRQHPSVPDYVALKAKALLVRGEQESVSDAVKLMQSLVEDYPAIVHYRLLLAGGYQQLAALAIDAKNPSAAKGQLEQALQVLDAVAAGHERPAIFGIYLDRLNQQIKELK